MRHVTTGKVSVGCRLGALVLATVLGFVCAPDARAGDRELVADGRPRYVLVLPDRAVKLHYPAGEMLHYAGDFLNAHVQKACGAQLRVLREGAAGAEPRRVFLGPTSFAKRHVRETGSLQREEFVLRTVGEDIVICGKVNAAAMDEGTLYGVYAFCERILGTRWYFHDEGWDKQGAGIHAPKRANIAVPDLAVRDRPAFLQHEGLIRQWGLPEAIARRWHPVLRFGNVRGKTANHTQTTWRGLYFKTHPEYFAKTAAGAPRRNAVFDYLCLSEPGVLTQMIENIHAWDTKKTPGLFGSNGATPDPGTVYFAPNDNLTTARACHCEQCRKRTRKRAPLPGQLSELVWEFVQRYAVAVDKRWPGRRLSVLAYSCYQQPPQDVKIPKNVDVTLVLSDVAHMHEPAVWNASMGRFDEWRRLLGTDGDRLSLWLNTSLLNFFSYVPAMYIHTWRKMLRYWQEQGVKGVFIVGFNPRLEKRRWPVTQRTMTALLYPFLWMQGRILWDPAKSPEPERLLREYCGDVYGPAAEPMVQFYELLIERWESSEARAEGVGRSEFLRKTQYPPSVRAKLKALLVEAESRVKPKTLPDYMVRYVSKTLIPNFFRELDTPAPAGPRGG